VSVKTLLTAVMLSLSLVTSSAAMKLSSPDFKEDEDIPESFTCDGRETLTRLPRAELDAHNKKGVFEALYSSDFRLVKILPITSA
jgi:hypothetical protein